MSTLRREDERVTLRQEEAKMVTLRREDEMVVCEVYDMKFILGGVLEYRNADFGFIIFMSTM
jgi:hypothetical protein